MSEHDQHHQHQKEAHDHARAEKKHEEQKHPEEAPTSYLPRVLLVAGVLLTLLVVLIWTFLV